MNSLLTSTFVSDILDGLTTGILYSLVALIGQALYQRSPMLPAGRTFYKMSGSGNDFIVVNATKDPAARLTDPELVQALCARGTGIGADGVVLLELSREADYKMTYLNSDGSRAALCETPHFVPRDSQRNSESCEARRFESKQTREFWPLGCWTRAPRWTSNVFMR